MSAADWSEQFCSGAARSVRVQYLFPQNGGTPNENQLGSRKTLSVDRSGWSGCRYLPLSYGFGFVSRKPHPLRLRHASIVP
jgi:hypothetical protein